MRHAPLLATRPLESTIRLRACTTFLMVCQTFLRAFRESFHTGVHTAAISRLKFANDDSHRFAAASHDGCVSICEIGDEATSGADEAGATPRISRVICKLTQHTRTVNGWFGKCRMRNKFSCADLCWSLTNDLLVTCCSDGAVRVWSMQAHNMGECVRWIFGPSSAQTSPVYAVLFQPQNNNLIVVRLREAL